MSETIKTSSYEKYAAGKVCSSKVVGWESSQTRVMRYQFSTTSIGASSVSWSISGVSLGGGNKDSGLRWYIGSSSTDHANAGKSTTDYNGGVTINSGTASGSADVVLQPNTTYYLWVFPASETYGWWYFGTEAILTVVGGTSSFTLSASSVNIGDTITANITRMSSSFKHTVEFYINDSYKQTQQNVETSLSFKIPTEWAAYMKTSTSCTAYCSVTTYSGSTKIGDTVKRSFTINVGNSAPTIGTITLTPTTINNISGLLIKGLNELTVKVSGCKPSEGSEIKSYTFSGPSLSKTITSNATEASVTIPYVQATSNGVLSNKKVTYTVTVTDTRGRSASSSNTIMLYDYYEPKITSFNAFRSTSSGTADAKGTYFHYDYTIDFASVNSKNTSITVKIYCNGSVKKTITGTGKSGSGNISIGSADATCRVYATVEDTFGKSGKSSEVAIFGSSRIVHIRSDGSGMAIGKMVDSTTSGQNLLDCAWNAEFNNNVNVTGTLSAGTFSPNSISTKSISINNSAINDFVVEQGKTSNEWYYKKWNSGKAECWKRFSHNTTVNTAWQNMYYGTATSRQSYPFAFTSEPVETATLQSNYMAMIVPAENNGTNNKTQSACYNVMRPQATTKDATFYFSLYVVGNWK